MDTHEKISAIVEHVTSKIKGRMPLEENNIHTLLKWVVAAGDGDHLEIGTLHGGSAIATALTKRKFGLKGKVYCIDPLNGYYLGREGGGTTDFHSNTEVSPAVLEYNLRLFGVYGDVEYVQAKSHPFPDKFDHLRFTSAFIDGDHWDGAPYIDWANVSARIKDGGYVVFDDHDPKHPAVMGVCEFIKDDSRFVLMEQEGITYTVRKG